MVLKSTKYSPAPSTHIRHKGRTADACLEPLPVDGGKEVVFLDNHRPLAAASAAQTVAHKLCQQLPGDTGEVREARMLQVVQECYRY